MSLYEALDRFAGTGVLACAGLVGAGLADGVELDGAALSRFLRERRQGEALGAVLDTLAHEIWVAQESRGFPQLISEAHATELAGLLNKVRLGADDFARVRQSQKDKSPQAELAAAWMVRATAAGVLPRAGLVDDLIQFLLERMFKLIAGDPHLLVGLAPTLLEFRATVAVVTPVQAAPLPAIPAPQTASPPVPASATTAVASLPLPAAVADLRERHKLPDAALKRLQTILAQQSMSAEHRLARLDELAGWLMATVAQLRAASNDAAEVRQIKTQAATALEQGDLERAMDLLKAIREHVRDARRRAETRLAEELQTLKGQMTEEAASTARLGEMAMARNDLDAAAEHFADAAGQLPAQEPALELGYRYRRAEALAAKAETSGDGRAIEAAAVAYRVCLRLITPERDAGAWARINVGLGDMLLALGARHPQSSIELEEAAHAFAEAAGVIDRAAKPMQWALVQLSHSAALIEIGARGDRQRHWKAAAGALLPVLDVFESRGAIDLAEAARAKLRMIAAGLDVAGGQALLTGTG